MGTRVHTITVFNYFVSHFDITKQPRVGRRSSFQQLFGGMTPWGNRWCNKTNLEKAFRINKYFVREWKGSCSNSRKRGIKTVDEIRTKQGSNPTISVELFDSLKSFVWILSMRTTRSTRQFFFVRPSFIERITASANSDVL